MLGGLPAAGMLCPRGPVSRPKESLQTHWSTVSLYQWLEVNTRIPSTRVLRVHFASQALGLLNSGARQLRLRAWPLCAYLPTCRMGTIIT